MNEYYLRRKSDRHDYVYLVIDEFGKRREFSQKGMPDPRNFPEFGIWRLDDISEVELMKYEIVKVNKVEGRS